jgi:hypothetical protein
MNSRWKMATFVLFLLAGVLWAVPALAVTVTITPEPEGFFFLFTGITPINDHDPVFTLDRETGGVTFGDGVLGERPPAGTGLVASYQQGSGQSGNIYTITDNFRPFLIPLRAFFENELGNPDLSLMVAGLATLGVQTRADGVMVQRVGIVPVPGSLGLAVFGLLGLIVFRNRRTIAGYR